MKFISLLCLLICIAGSLCAIETSSVDGLFIGISPETNSQTRKGVALGGNGLIGLGINSQFTAGLKFAYFHNLDTVFTQEYMLFMRYHLQLWHWPRSNDGPFVQPEAGIVVFQEYGDFFPAFSGGASLGWRFNFAQRWFCEPAVRVGYPHIWGAYVTVGYAFPLSLAAIRR